MIFWEKNNFLKFFWFFFFQRGGPLGTESKIYIFLVFQNFQDFFKDDLNGTYKMLKETKSWNMSSFQVFIEELQRIYSGMGKICPVWPGIGLKYWHYECFLGCQPSARSLNSTLVNVDFSVFIKKQLYLNYLCV